MGSNSSRRYSEGLKTRAVQMVADLHSDTTSEREAMGRVADLLGVGTADTVRKWVRQAEIDAGDRAGQTSEESELLRKLRRAECRTQAGQPDLEGGVGFVRRRTRPALSVVVEFISAHQHQGGALMVSSGVSSRCAPYCPRTASRSPQATYYAHRTRCGPSKADWADAQVIDAIHRLPQSNLLYRVLYARKAWIVLRNNGLNFLAVRGGAGHAGDEMARRLQASPGPHHHRRPDRITGSGPGAAAIRRAGTLSVAMKKYPLVARSRYPFLAK